MFSVGIIDPVKVTRTGVQNAASVASVLLTTEVAITDEPKPEGEGMPAMGGGMPGMGIHLCSVHTQADVTRAMGEVALRDKSRVPRRLGAGASATCKATKG